MGTRILTRTALVVALTLTITACNGFEEPQGIYTCMYGSFLKTESPDVNTAYLGSFDPDDQPGTVARSCFKQGWAVGVAALACEVARVMETAGDTGGEYTLLFTDEDGASYGEVDMGEFVLLRIADDVYTLSELAYIAIMEGYYCPLQFP